MSTDKENKMAIDEALADLRVPEIRRPDWRKWSVKQLTKRLIERDGFHS